MKLWKQAVLVTVAAALMGCAGEDAGSSDGPEIRETKQTHFDLTVVADREYFTPIDMEYKSSFGPYAVYEVTGPEPRLVGPRVLFPGDAAYAMLCGAKHYFPSAFDGATALNMRMTSGEGDLEFVVDPMEPQSPGECTSEDDVFGENTPIPESPGGEPGDGSDGGDDGTDGGDDGSDGGGSDSPYPPLDPSKPDQPTAPELPELTRAVQFDVDFDQAPEAGSVVLIRRVALMLDRLHNESHVIQPLCCTGPDCGLGEQQPSDQVE